MMEAVSRTRQVILWLSISVMIFHVVLFQIKTVKCQLFQYDKELFDASVLPFCVELPGPLRSGKIIKILGIFENTTDDTGPNKDDKLQYPSRDSVGHMHHDHWHMHDSSFQETESHWSSSRTSFRERTGAVKPNARLNVILRSRCLSPESPFQLSLKFNDKTVRRNSFQNGEWGEEETDGPFPFSLGAQFLLLIEVQPDGYIVKGNGVPLWTFEHRFSFDDVKYLQLTGDRVFVWKIELVDPNIKGQQHSLLVYPVPLTKPILHPTSPFCGQFPEEVQAGKAIRIKGYFPTDPNRSSVDLCAENLSGPIMLHLDIRFQYQTDVRLVIRNSRINGKWQTEGRGGPFPFSVGEPFDLIIEITPQSFNISVNNHHCWTYAHKLPYTDISTISITKGMNIWNLEYIDFPKKANNEQSSLMLTEERDLNNCSSASSVYNNIVYIMRALPFFLFLKAM